MFAGIRGAPGRIRTCDLRIRSPLLYPAELRGPRGTRGVPPGRGGRIRTGDLSAPNRTRYQAAPRPDGGEVWRGARGGHRTSVGEAVRDSSRRGPRPRGAVGSMFARFRHGVVAAFSLGGPRGPGYGARRRRPGRAGAGGQRALRQRRAMPGQAAGDDLREATLCLMNAERAARGLGRLQAEPLLGRVGGELRAPDGARAFFDHASPGGSTMIARIKATSYLRDVVVVVGRREPRVGHRRPGHAARDGPRLDALGRSPRQPAGPPLRRRRHRRRRGRAGRSRRGRARRHLRDRLRAPAQAADRAQGRC